MSFRLISQQRLIALFLFLFLIMSVVYFNLNYIQQNYESSQWSRERCFTELTSIKYQLNAVTEYKNHIDKMLTETLQKHESDKERFKDIMDSCVAMKQQSSICQSQFEDLQSECKKTKEDFEKLKKEAVNNKKAR